MTVRAPAPNTSKVTVEVRARAAQSAPPAAPVSAAKQGQADPLWRWWPVGLGVLAVLAIVTLVVPAIRRRRQEHR